MRAWFAAVLLACSSSAHETSKAPKSVPAFQPLRDLGRVQIGLVLDQEERLVHLTSTLPMSAEIQALSAPEEQPRLLRVDDASSAELLKGLWEESKKSSFLAYFADGHVVRAEQIGVSLAASPCDGVPVLSRLLQLPEEPQEVGHPVLLFPEPVAPNLPSAARTTEVFRVVPSELAAFVASHPWRFPSSELLWYVLKTELDGVAGDEYFVARASVEWVGDRDVRSASVESFWLRKNSQGAWEPMLRKTRTLSSDETIAFRPWGLEVVSEVPRIVTDLDGDRSAEVLFENTSGFVFSRYVGQRFISTSIGYQLPCDLRY